MKKFTISLLFAGLMVFQLSTVKAQSATDPTAPVAAPAAPEQPASAPSVAPSAASNVPTTSLAKNQIPKLLIRWDCGTCELNDKVAPLIEKIYAEKAAATGYSVSENETADVTVTKYRQRPPGARVMFGFMAGKDILETRITFRGKEFLAGDYSANAWHGMDSLCETVAHATLKHLTDNLQSSTVAATEKSPVQ